MGNYTGDDRDGSDHAGQKERRNEGVLQRTLTEERIGSWSDQKLEKMIKRNSVVKDNEDHVREVHTLSRTKSNKSIPALPLECSALARLLQGFILIHMFFSTWLRHCPH